MMDCAGREPLDLCRASDRDSCPTEAAALLLSTVDPEGSGGNTADISPQSLAGYLLMGSE